jgi:hypothetical protein
MIYQMALSGFVDLIMCKMDFAAKQNVTKVWGLALRTLQDANRLTMPAGSRC